jgi:hypothetical protein
VSRRILHSAAWLAAYFVLSAVLYSWPIFVPALLAWVSVDLYRTQFQLDDLVIDLRIVKLQLPWMGGRS